MLHIKYLKRNKTITMKTIYILALTPFLFLKLNTALSPLSKHSNAIRQYHNVLLADTTEPEKSVKKIPFKNFKKDNVKSFKNFISSKKAVKTNPELAEMEETIKSPSILASEALIQNIMTAGSAHENLLSNSTGSAEYNEFLSNSAELGEFTAERPSAINFETLKKKKEPKKARKIPFRFLKSFKQKKSAGKKNLKKNSAINTEKLLKTEEMKAEKISNLSEKIDKIKEEFNGTLKLLKDLISNSDLREPEKISKPLKKPILKGKVNEKIMQDL